MFLPDPAPHYVCRRPPEPKPEATQLNNSLTRRLLTLEQSLFSTTCTACGSSFYKDFTGNDVCQECPPFMHSQDGVTCLVMPKSTNASVAATTPTPQSPVYVVKMAVSLPMTTQEFNGGQQLKFKQSVARAAGVSSDDVTIDRIVDMNNGLPARRRLLTSSIRVDTSVQAPNEIAASAISTGLTADSLNSALVAAGLPAATILEAPTFASDRQMTTPAPKSDRQVTTTPVSAPVATSESGSNVAAIVGGALGGLSIVSFVIFARLYHLFGM